MAAHNTLLVTPRYWEASTALGKILFSWVMRSSTTVFREIPLRSFLGSGTEVSVPYFHRNPPQDFLSPFSTLKMLVLENPRLLPASGASFHSLMNSPLREY